jgi:hypothetical protein
LREDQSVILKARRIVRPRFSPLAIVAGGVEDFPGAKKTARARIIRWTLNSGGGPGAGGGRAAPRNAPVKSSHSREIFVAHVGEKSTNRCVKTGPIRAFLTLGGGFRGKIWQFRPKYLQNRLICGCYRRR